MILLDPLVWNRPFPLFLLNTGLGIFVDNAKGLEIECDVLRLKEIFL